MVSGKAPEDEWKTNFRISWESFLSLVEMIQPHVQVRSSKIQKDVISVEKRVVVKLYYLKDQGLMRMMVNSFGIARNTLGGIIREICSILTHKIRKQLTKFPINNKEEVLKASSEFQARFGFPQVIGCIDDTHIPIKQPEENATDCYSYKMFYSINCQAICDAYGRLIKVEVKCPGSVHDARVFASCSAQKNFVSGSFPTFYKELLPNRECIPELLLGDPAYPLLPYLMKEYDNCRSNKQVTFNQMLRSARNQIECAFGRLKARWRILMRPLDVPTKFPPDIIYACFVLHNFIEINKADVDLGFVTRIVSEEKKYLQKVDKINSYQTTLECKIRDTITDYFKDVM